MKKLFILFVIAFVLFSFRKNDLATFYRKEHYQKEKWYPKMISELAKEYRADVYSSQWMKNLNSNSDIAFEKSLPKLIVKLGKINENEIRVVFRENEKDPTVFVFVETMNDVHNLFMFNTKTKELKRMFNKGLIILVWGERISVKECTKDGILFYSDSKEVTKSFNYRKHLYFNRKENTFQQTKSCEVVKGIEKCKDGR